VRQQRKERPLRNENILNAWTHETYKTMCHESCVMNHVSCPHDKDAHSMRCPGLIRWFRLCTYIFIYFFMV